MLRASAKYQAGDPVFIDILRSAWSVELLCIEAHKALQGGPSLPDVRAELDAALARLEDDGPWVRGLTDAKVETWGQAWDQTYGPNCLRTHNVLRLCEYYDGVRDRFRRPIAEYERFDVEFRRDIEATAVRHWIEGNLSNHFFPIWQYRMNFEIERALARCLRVHLALNGRARDATLDDLGLPPEACTDPFDGSPLRIKRTPAGITVYSVGVNRKDDGGADLYDPNSPTEFSDDVGLGPN
jgi:hypothetical protein